MPITPIKLTFEEYCALPETHLPHELIDGELRMPAAPNRRHQEIPGNIYSALQLHVRCRGLGHVLFSPLDAVLDRQRPLVLQPDILFVGTERSGILGDKVYGAPDLVVEIFSPAGELFDRTEKAAFYAQHGVREYWLVDPASETIEVRRLEPTGQELLGVHRRGDTLGSSILPGISLPTDDAFAE
jgi:Uma2 family endonuclease